MPVGPEIIAAMIEQGLVEQDLVWTEWLMVVVFVVGVVAWGFRMRKAAGTLEGSFLAGRKVPPFIASLSTVATNLNANDFIGGAGMTYAFGVIILHGSWVNGSALLFVSIFVISKLRRLNVFTLGEWLEKRYSAPVGISYSIIWSLVWMLVNLGLYLYGGAFVLESLVGWDLYTSIVVLSIIAAFYTLIGGFGAVVATDVLQIAIMFFPFVFLSWAVWQDVGGLSELAARLPEAKGVFWTGDTPLGPLHIFILGSFFMGTSYWSCEAQVIQRPLSTQNEEDATLSFLGTTFWLAILAPFLISIPVLGAILYFPDLPNNDLAMPSMIRKFLPHGLYGVTIVGLMAGVFSSADSQINAFATMFTKDIYSRLIRPGRTETHYLKASKVAGAIFTFAAIGSALLFTKAEHGMMVFALSILVTIMPPFAAITVFGALSRRINPTGALVGLVHGGAVAITLVILSVTGALAFIADVDMILRAAVTFTYTAAVAWVASKRVRDAGEADASATSGEAFETGDDEVDISLDLTPRVIRMMIVLLLGLAGVTALWSYYFRAH